MRTRRLAAGTALVLLALMLSACRGSDAAGSSRPTVAKIGGLAPEINLKSLTGDQIVLSRLQGRPVIVNFWATWCGPCREEFPALVRTYNKYRDQGVVVIGVNYQDHNTDDGVRTFMKDTLVDFPIVRDVDEQVGQMYRVNGLPTSVFIDRQGIIRDIVVGGPMTDTFINQEIAKLK